MASDLLRNAVEDAEHQLLDGRQSIRQLHDRGLDGLQVCGRLASLVDGIVIKLYDAALANLPAEESEVIRNRVALVGLGSYGRRQLAPYSDVDLVILHDAAQADELTPLVRPLTQSLFDVGFDLGYSVRTVKDAMNLARTDAIVCTSQIGGRLIAGKQSLYDRFRDSFAKLLSKRQRSLALAFHEARTAERRQYGETVYLLEPNVKRSRGALRDLHLLQWLGYMQYGEVDLDRLRLLGAMSKFEHHRLLNARTFLLRVRNEMHFHAQSRHETLSRAEQLRLAEVFGHRERAGLLPVEHFMRDYFRHTNHLWQMVRRREAALAAPSAMTRILDPVLGKKVAGDYRIGLKYVTATPTGLARMREDLESVLEIVAASQASGKLLDQGTWSALLLAAPDCPDTLTPAVADQFLTLLGDPQQAGEMVRILHELGYLEKFVPAIRRVRCLLQFNQYHKYTVDEHSLRAVGAAAGFLGRDDVLGEAYASIRDKRLLHLALLLHDLGKGQEGDHSEVGRRIAEEMCQRLMLPDRDAETVATLVHRHLAMSHLAFRRDTSDADEISAFRDLIGTGERLKMLFVLTCADLEAVGPGVLNDWKIRVLSDLYLRTSQVAAGGDPSEVPLPVEAPGLSLESHRRRVFEQLTAEEQADPWYTRQVDQLPANYLAGRAVAETVELLRACRQLPERGAYAVGRYRETTKTIEWVAAIRQGAGRGIFSTMAGVLSSRGMQILAADVEVLSDALLLLRFTAVPPLKGPTPTDEMLHATAEAFIKAVDSDEPPRFSRKWGEEAAEAATRLTRLPIEVRIDNKATQQGTVIEVFTFDRAGLLYELARRLHDLDLIIRCAKIGTYLDQVVDVFYVVDRQGAKITSDETLEQVRREMLAIAQSQPNATPT